MKRLNRVVLSSFFFFFFEKNAPCSKCKMSVVEFPCSNLRMRARENVHAELVNLNRRTLFLFFSHVDQFCVLPSHLASCRRIYTIRMCVVCQWVPFFLMPHLTRIIAISVQNIIIIYMMATVLQPTTRDNMKNNKNSCILFLIVFLFVMRHSSIL